MDADRRAALLRRLHDTIADALNDISAGDIEAAKWKLTWCQAAVNELSIGIKV